MGLIFHLSQITQPTQSAFPLNIFQSANIESWRKNTSPKLWFRTVVWYAYTSFIRFYIELKLTFMEQLKKLFLWIYSVNLLKVPVKLFSPQRTVQRVRGFSPAYLKFRARLWPYQRKHTPVPAPRRTPPRKILLARASLSHTVSSRQTLLRSPGCRPQ